MLTFAFSDTHGCLDMLSLLVAKCKRFAEAAGDDGKDPLFVNLGDMVDRGTDSAGVVRFWRDFEKTNRVKNIRGNHDQMFVEAMLYGDPLDWIHNDMRVCANSYGYPIATDGEREVADTIAAMRMDERVLDDCRWLDSLPLSYQDDQRIFVHAGLDPMIPLDEQHPYTLLWIRDGRNKKGVQIGPDFLGHQGEYEKWIVHGHTCHMGHPNVLEPERKNNRSNLDTGAAYGGKMTCGVFMDLFPQPVGFLDATPMDVLKSNRGIVSDAVPSLKR